MANFNTRLGQGVLAAFSKLRMPVLIVGGVVKFSHKCVDKNFWNIYGGGGAFYGVNHADLYTDLYKLFDRASHDRVT